MRRVLIILPLLVVCACNPQFYKPNALCVPLLRSRGQTTLNVSSTLDPVFSASAAHALTRDFGVTGGIFAIADINGYNGWLAEGGAGYFGNPGAGNLIVEGFAGIGYGRLAQQTGDSIPQSLFELHVIRPYVQANVGYLAGNLIPGNIEAAFSVRAVALLYSGIRRYPDATGTGFDLLDSIGAHTYIMLEPGLTVRGGFQWVQFQFQYVYSGQLGSAPFSYDNSNLSLGLNFRF